MQNWGIAIVIGVLVLLLLGGLYWLECLRVKRLAKIAIELEMSFDPKAKRLNKTWFGSMIGNCDRGYFKRIRNHISGAIDHVEIELFDYHFFTGLTSPRGHPSTIIVMRFKEWQIPQFSLEIEDFVHRTLGPDDINFEDDSAFSKQYYLFGLDEDEVRSLFDARLRKAITEFGSFVSFEADGDVIVIRLNEVAEYLESVSSQLAKAYDIAILLGRRANEEREKSGRRRRR